MVAMVAMIATTVVAAIVVIIAIAIVIVTIIITIAIMIIIKSVPGVFQKCARGVPAHPRNRPLAHPII